MARVHHVKRSRKDQGKCGKCGDALAKGSAYRHFAPGFRGRKRVRCMKGGCSPRPSDLTGSDKLQRDAIAARNALAAALIEAVGEAGLARALRAVGVFKEGE